MSILDENVSNDGFLTPRMRTALVGMAPWLRFIGLTGLILCSLIFIFFVVALIVGISEAVPALGAFAALPAFAFVFYLAFLALGIYIYYLLFQAGNHLQRFARHGHTSALEDSFAKQKTFWTVIGVILAVYLGFLVLIIIFGSLAAMLT